MQNLALILLAVGLLSSPSARAYFSGYTQIEMLAGGGTAKDRDYMRDISQYNTSSNHQGLIFKEVDALIASGQEVLLGLETKNYDLAVFTTITQIAGSKKYRVSYDRFEKKKDTQLSNVAYQCLAARSDLTSRFECYEEHYLSARNSEVIDSLAWAIFGRFAVFANDFAYQEQIIYGAIQQFKIDLSSQANLLNFPLQGLALSAFEYVPDLNSNFFWSKGWQTEDSKDSRKFFEASRLLMTLDLYYASYNMQCSTNGTFPGPGKAKIKDAFMFAGPQLLTQSEVDKYVKNGDCHHYAVGIGYDELYKELEALGYTYNGTSWVK